MIEFIVKYYDRILSLFGQHLLLTVLSLGIALLIALPLGYWLSRGSWAAGPVLSVLGVIYSIPSMAMFAFLIPVLGLGTKSAITALVAYCLLILVRNVKAGFQAIDPAITEAGKGMGLSRLQLFQKIELPLALPVILGGIRIAATSTIGIATIAAWINAGGLGVILFEGLYQNHVPKMIWGTIFVALLAIAANQLLLRLERRFALRARGETQSAVK
jgi:osmoprotectant transport system permease protein